MPTVENVLSGLAGDHATGALRLDGTGTFYLTDGCVTYAESPAAPPLEDLLTSSGRVSVHAVRQAMRAATDDRPGGLRLIRQGVLTRGELELCVLGAVLDAAYFLSDATACRSAFQPGERHWLGAQWHFDVTELFRECKRRRAQLNQVWPSSELDALPVVPVRRVPAQGVVLTSLQWEVVVGADATATPADLAHRLGRPAYSVLLAVRQLAAAGLLRLPRGELPAAPVTGPAAEPGAALAAVTGTVVGTVAAVLPGTAADGLPRRTACTARRRDAVPDGADEPGWGNGAGWGEGWTGVAETPPWLPPATGDPTDVNLLVRLRNALEALT